MNRKILHSILSVRDLTTRLQFGNDIWTVVDHLNFDLYQGKTLALVGESGCGKSITALSIMGILPKPPVLCSAGKILYRDRNLLELTEREMRKIRGAKIAMVFQDPISSLNPVYTIGNQLVEVAELHLNLSGDEASERAAKALKEVGMISPYELLKAYPHQLSGGMKQRVMIAMALMCEPDILIADEPTTALDTTIQAQVLKLMRDLQEKMGMAILLITHDMGVVAEMADEVIVMYMAQGIEHGPVHNIFEQCAHPYTKGLFDSRPVLQTRNKKLPSIPGNVPSFKHIPSGCRFHPRCPFVMEKCRKGDVPEFVIDQNPNHLAKCWLNDGSEESQNRLISPDFTL
jgi:oligopeptide/dipeptide ABC transporter ATP-binding protein